MEAIVYILADRGHRALYVGTTDDLRRRMHLHRTVGFDGFSARLGETQLVYFEAFPDMRSARARTRSLKRARFAPARALIEATNPDWRDFWHDGLVNRPRP